ncbi:MAG: sugar ABC transporter ATP-binding protein [Mahellales bacterium]|jgi:ribose transport system ATP-binding protein
MTKETLLEVRGIHKFFPGVHALNNVSFTLEKGQVHALMGENGAGKSTLIKILAGVYSFEKGEYFLEGKPANIKAPHEAIKKGISVIYQELNLMPQLSIAENIYFSHFPRSRMGRVNWREVDKKTKEILEYIGLNESPHMKVGYLPVAKQQLVEIAKAISTNAKVIVMDEPTSALSPKEIDNLFRVIRDLKERGVGIIYISHKLEEIFEISDMVTVLRDGGYVGTEPTFRLDKNKLVSMMVGRELSDMYPKQNGEPGEIVLRVEGLTTEKVYDVSFKVRAGEIVGFSGLMGSGRTELARAIIGADERISGKITLCGQEVPPNSTDMAQKMGIGYVPENRKEHGIFADSTVKKNMTISSIKQFKKGIRIDASSELATVKDMINKLAIKTPSVDQIISKLSGGNQQKVILARFLMKKDLKVLVIDEPTRGIDVGAKAEIYSILDNLAHQGLAIVMMSSEMPEVLSMSDRIYVMKKGRITAEVSRYEATQEILLHNAI